LKLFYFFQGIFSERRNFFYYKHFYPGVRERSREIGKGIGKITAEFRTGRDLTGTNVPSSNQNSR
jgi:hypothetical protein